MAFNLYDAKGCALEQQRFTWRELVQTPISKLDDDAFTRVRIILMNGIETEALRCSHMAARVEKRDPAEVLPPALSDPVGLNRTGIHMSPLDSRAMQTYEGTLPEARCAQAIEALGGDPTCQTPSADQAGWEALIALAEDQDQLDMVNDFSVALDEQRGHLLRVQSWYEESIGIANPGDIDEALLDEPLNP